MSIINLARVRSKFISAKIGIILETNNNLSRFLLETSLMPHSYGLNKIVKKIEEIAIFLS